MARIMYGADLEKKSMLRGYAVVMAVFGALLVLGGFLVYQDYKIRTQATIQIWNARPADDPEYGSQMQYALQGAKYWRKYGLKLSMAKPKGFNVEKYKDEHPDEAVYCTKPTQDGTAQWLLIFSDLPPRDSKLKYTWANPMAYPR